jgi:hypothetical protein
MLAAFFLTRRHKGSKARSFLFRAKGAKEQGRKGIETQTKGHEVEMLAAFFFDTKAQRHEVFCFTQRAQRRKEIRNKKLKIRNKEMQF